MEKTTLYLPESLQGELRALARSTGRSQAELIREALTEYVGRHEHPWPTSIGIARDGRLAPDEAKAWVRSGWDTDHRRHRASPESG